MFEYTMQKDKILGDVYWTITRTSTHAIGNEVQNELIAALAETVTDAAVREIVKKAGN